jgi:molecular chaperone HscC
MHFRDPNQRKGAVMIYQGESIHPAENLHLGNLDIKLPEGLENTSFLLTYTYDLDGTLEVEVSVPDTDVKFKTHIKNGEAYFDDHLERRFERLAHLKVLPHEQQKNRELQSRLERLFEENIGEDREYIANLIRHFNHALNTYNTKKIAQAFEEIEEALNQFSGYRF